jgi:mono/diheme cytochrome c family protein
MFRRHAAPAAVLLVLTSLASAPSAQERATGASVPAAHNSPTAAALYQVACSTCHGSDGRGNPVSHVGFDLELPDFTDCGFATPEVDQDWATIVRLGGPARAFDRHMPAFGDALSDEDIARVLGHVRSFCRDAAWPRGELNLPRPLVTEKAFPENEAVLTTTVSTRGRTAIGSTVVYEHRIGARTQWELAVPFELQGDDGRGGGWSRGLGDAAVAVKHAVYHDLAKGAIVSLGGEVSLPTGKESEGLGSGVTVLEPFLAAGQIVGGSGFVQVHTGFEISTDTEKAERAYFVRVAGGATLFQGRYQRSWTPMLELLGARELSSGEPVLWDVVPQVQISLSRRQHILLDVGVRLPLNERADRGRTFMTYLLWDWFDGGLFSGWR